MADSLIEGPLMIVHLEDGTPVPFYVVPFDKDGLCSGPRTADDAVRAAGAATDLFLFSHGWNNDWATATGRYYSFLAEYSPLRARQWPSPRRDYRPVLVGIFWPSTALVAPWEKGPDIAADPGLKPDELAAVLADGSAERAGMDALAEMLPEPDRQRFYALVQRSDGLGDAEADELATLVAPALAAAPDELDDPGTAPSARELRKIWDSMPESGPPSSSESGGFIDGGSEPAGSPATAGLLGRLDPRQLVRLATVLLMKDRAGRVGGWGVAPLLRRLLTASPDVRVHLIGHSYGGKVVLSALCVDPAPTRPVESVLLLQPAMSALCFAADGGSGRPGGYRSALTRARQPVLTTFSSKDVPLTRLFHWAVRRPSDLAEAVIAGVPAPSRYAALGGFGPQGCDADCEVVDPVSPPGRYPLAGGKRVIGVKADSVIAGHGKVTSPATAWMLLNQVME